MMEISRQTIKGMRTAAGLTQQELADLTGIPQGRIAKWEIRGTIPNAEDYQKVLLSTSVPKKTEIQSPDKNQFSDFELLISAKNDQIALMNRYLAFMENEVLHRLKKIDINSETTAMGIERMSQAFDNIETQRKSDPAIAPALESQNDDQEAALRRKLAEREREEKVQ